jgi:hypothetical protein
MNFFRLIKKNRNHDEKSFQFARISLIEASIRKGDKSYPTNGSEIAVLRKQIYKILQVLKENGLDAEISDFIEHYKFVENKKNEIDKMLEKGDENVS